MTLPCPSAPPRPLSQFTIAPLAIPRANASRSPDSGTLPPLTTTTNSLCPPVRSRILNSRGRRRRAGAFGHEPGAFPAGQTMAARISSSLTSAKPSMRSHMIRAGYSNADPGGQAFGKRVGRARRYAARDRRHESATTGAPSAWTPITRRSGLIALPAIKAPQTPLPAADRDEHHVEVRQRLAGSRACRWRRR